MQNTNFPNCSECNNSNLFDPDNLCPKHLELEHDWNFYDLAPDYISPTDKQAELELDLLKAEGF